MSGMLSSIQQVLSQESSNFMSFLLHLKLDKQSLGPNPPHKPIMGQNPPFLPFHRSSCLAVRSQTGHAFASVQTYFVQPFRIKAQLYMSSPKG